MSVVPVQLKRAGHWQPAVIRFGTETDVVRISKWPDFLAAGAIGTGTAKESADYAKDSVERWRKHLSRGRAAGTPKEYGDLIKANPKDDVAILLVIEADWWAPGDLLGFAYLRRTWADSIYMEFLAKHPLAAYKEPPDLNVTRVTEAMLVGISSLMDQIEAPHRPTWAWWEATAGSAAAYGEFFAPTTPCDLVIVSAKELSNCRSRIIHEIWPDKDLRVS